MPSNSGKASSRRAFLKSSLAAPAAAFALPTVVTAPIQGAAAPSSLINIGVIGTGRIGRKHDMPGIIRNDKLARITAVCDLDSNRVQEGKQFVESQYAKRGSHLYRKPGSSPEGL